MSDSLKRMRQQDKLKTIVVLFLALLFVALFLKYKFQINAQTWSLPLYYLGADDFATYLSAQDILKTGWIWSNPNIGAPFTGSFLDFPTCLLQNFDALVLKIILVFEQNPVIAIKIEYLLASLFTVCTSFYVLRKMKVSYLLSFCGAITYALLPFYFLRGIRHLTLSMYQFVPLSVLLCYWCYKQEIFSIKFSEMLHNKKNYLALFFILLITNNGIGYYSIFTCFFLLITGIIQVCENKKVSYLKSSFISISLITLFFLITVIPFFIHINSVGKNPLAVQRNPIGSDVYGLKITQMLLPLELPGNSDIEKQIKNYQVSAPLVNENVTSYLGPMGTIGFLLLLLGIIFKNNIENTDVELFAKLNFAGLVFGIVGGFGTIFAILCAPFLRGGNRISIFLAFFGIVTFCQYCDVILAKINTNKQKMLSIGIVIFVIAGIFMQTKKTAFKGYNVIEPFYASDRAFMENIEKTLPEHSMVYQLPYHQFPESPNVEKMEDYQLFAGPILSKNLRWSYGNLRGRQGDYWEQTLNKLQGVDRIRAIPFAGFNGIYLDARAYKLAELNKIVAEYSKEIGKAPNISSNGNLYFWPLLDYKKKIFSGKSNKELTEIQENLLNVAYLAKMQGIYSEEKDNKLPFHWMDNNCIIEIENPGLSYLINLNFIPIIPQQKQARFVIKVNSKLLTDIMVQGSSEKINKTVKIEHGKNVIEMTTDALRGEYPADERRLFVKLSGFQISQLLPNMEDIIKYSK